MRSIVVWAALLVATLAACNRNVEPYVEGEQPREPDLSRIFPDASESPGAQMGAGRMGATRSAGTQSDLPAAVDSTDAGAKTIYGRVDLAPDLAGAVPSGATLFVIARPAGGTGGPPLAVRRVPNAILPYDFEIGPQHVMIQGVPFSGEIQLSVRLDGDGDAMTRRPGDLSGAAGEAVSPGTRDVQIVLDQQI